MTENARVAVEDARMAQEWIAKGREAAHRGDYLAAYDETQRAVQRLCGAVYALAGADES